MTIKKISTHNFFGFSKILPKKAKKGTAPGKIKYLGKKREQVINIHMIDYEESRFTELTVNSFSDAVSFIEKPAVTWININGVHHTETIESVGQALNLHNLLLEDIVNTTQRPIAEEYDNHIFMILKMIYFDETTKEITLEQVSLLLGKNFVVTFQEKAGDVFEPVRQRIRNNKGRIRKAGADYLAYAIIDAVVDHYFTVLEKISDQTSAIEKELIENPTQATINTIYRLKQELMFLKKAIWPMREMIGQLIHMENDLIDPKTILYVKDAHDHTVQVVETLETLRDMSGSMLDLYMSTISNKMNEVMKVLTIFAAIFIPITFIAGVYGMNFDNMPELHWKWGYFGVWGIILGMAGGMLLFFKKKKWL